jgi:hypothetical protein
MAPLASSFSLCIAVQQLPVQAEYQFWYSDFTPKESVIKVWKIMFQPFETP